MFSKKEHNPKAPHQAVILVTTEIMERLHDGRVAPLPIEKMSAVYTIIGKNLEECREKTETFLERLQKNDNKEEQEGSTSES